MVAGHLREKRGYYHMVLSYTDEYGKRQTPSKSTGLPVKGNKKRAEAMLQEFRQKKELELQERISEHERRNPANPSDVLFTQFMLDWLEMMRSSVEVTTFASYSFCIKSRINPYFDEKHPGLKLREITPKHIQDYYTFDMKENGVKANTVIHRHANIRKALQYAFKIGLLESNPADRIERPKKEKFSGSIYNEKELEQLFASVKDDPIELGVILAAFYGLRRSEVVGLKWSAIDFEKKTITICHTVTQVCVEGKSTIIEKDRKLVALVYPDYESVDEAGISQDDLEAIMNENLKNLNKMVASYESVSRIKLFPTEFEKTPKKSIKRYLYNQLEE